MKVCYLALAMLLLLAFPSLASIDGTLPPLDSDSGGESPGTDWFRNRDVYVINPYESVSISATDTWQDNRLRAYWSDGLFNVNGFLLFDVSMIPDNLMVTDMVLTCYLENAFGSPNANPVVDVYYSADDGWTRNSAVPGSLSLDVLLVDDVLFNVYVPSHDFVLDVNAHDWSGDLADDEICIGLTNDVTHYSYVYFFGAYGDPAGTPPVLTITVEPTTAIFQSNWSGLKGLF